MFRFGKTQTLAEKTDALRLEAEILRDIIPDPPLTMRHVLDQVLRHKKTYKLIHTDLITEEISNVLIIQAILNGYPVIVCVTRKEDFLTLNDLRKDQDFGFFEVGDQIKAMVL